MINELTIKGLKCFEEAEFHFDPCIQSIPDCTGSRRRNVSV